VRNERKYRILIILTTVLSILLLSNCGREYFRMAAAEERQAQEYVALGALLYAQNCVQCHGPRGEGVIGMPLNRTEFKHDPRTTAGKAVFDMLYLALAAGRPGNSTHPQWERMSDGKWLSYTSMPAWHKDKGGPLDDHHIRGLVTFIMLGDWGLIGHDKKAPIPRANLDPDVKLPSSGNADLDARAHALLNNYQKSLCLTCHAIGSKGGYVGPDLSKVGAWGIDEKFLKDWIRRSSGPDAMPHDERMPVYWSSNRAVAGPRVQIGPEKRIVSEGPYQMPVVPLTDEELDILVRYLLSLR
jgi:hypothetical protein